MKDLSKLENIIKLIQEYISENLDSTDMVFSVLGDDGYFTNIVVTTSLDNFEDQIESVMDTYDIIVQAQQKPDGVSVGMFFTIYDDESPFSYN